MRPWLLEKRATERSHVMPDASLTSYKFTRYVATILRFTQTRLSFLFPVILSSRPTPYWYVIFYLSQSLLTTFSSIREDLVQMLSSYVAPFFSLQYPTATPAHPDSFPHSAYYNAGKLDICILISYIAIMAVLRDAFRLGIFEPLARWKLLRDLEFEREKVLNKANGSAINHHHVANGNGNAYGNGHANGNDRVVLGTRKKMRQLNRSVLRFAEQGWSVVYYSLQLSFGIVRIFSSFFFFKKKKLPWHDDYA